MAPDSRRSARRGSVRPRMAVVLLVLRVLAAVAAFQLSQMGHFAEDIVEVVVTGRHAAVPEEESAPDHDCPPGCPTCHHVHFSGASLPPAFVAPVTRAPVNDGYVSIVPQYRSAPQRPALPGV